MAKRLQFDHLVPVGVGGVVWAEATLDRIEGRRLVFTLSVSESAGLVAAGKLIRVIVDRECVPLQRPLSPAPATRVPPDVPVAHRARLRGSCRSCRR